MENELYLCGCRTAHISTILELKSENDKRPANNDEQPNEEQQNE